MRDFDKNPYTADEERVAEYIVDKTGIGGGDDPIGFILASHAFLQHKIGNLIVAADKNKLKLCHFCYADIKDYPEDSLAYNKHMIGECCIGECG